MPEEIFTTHHLALAATLCYLGYSMELKGKHPRKAFCFQYDKKLEKIVKEFWDGKLNVEPGKYYQELRTIKIRLKESS